MHYGLRPLQSSFFLLLGSQGGEVGRRVIEKETLGPSDQFAAVKAVSLALQRTDDVSAVETVVDELVLLSHAVTFGASEVYLLGSLLLLLHSNTLFIILLPTFR